MCDQASETLIALCEAGWIGFNGTRDYIDHWVISELGHGSLQHRLCRASRVRKAVALWTK
jgi:hypothetical protein